MFFGSSFANSIIFSPNLAVRSSKSYLFLLILLPVVFIDIKKDFKYFSPDLIAENLKKVSRIIAEDVGTSKNWNIVGIRGGDRYDRNGVDYRYYLETFYHKRSWDWDVIDYQNSKILYIISNVGEIEPLVSNVWEVELFKPKEIVQKWKVDNSIIYKLVN